MTEKISNIILEIETKVSFFKERWEEAEKQNSLLTGETTELKSKIDSIQTQLITLEEKLKKAEEENNILQEQTKNIRTTASDTAGVNDSEIDFLVSEIDQCISQIKSSL